MRGLPLTPARRPRPALALPALLALLATLALSGAASGGPTCPVRAELAVPVLDDHYLHAYKGMGNAYHVQLWMETNHVPGLQTQPTTCRAGDAWAADHLRLSLPVAPFQGIPL